MLSVIKPLWKISQSMTVLVQSVCNSKSVWQVTMKLRGKPCFKEWYSLHSFHWQTHNISPPADKFWMRIICFGATGIVVFFLFMSLFVCDLNRTPVVIAKYGCSCVHISGISTCRKSSRETVSHPQRPPLQTLYKISVPVHVIVTNNLLPLSLAHRPQQKHHSNLLFSITKTLLTHTIASFWRKQCWTLHLYLAYILQK